MFDLFGGEVMSREMKIQLIVDLYNRPLSELAAEADRVRSAHAYQGIDLCTICNGKSGLCTEDCRYCIQSAHYVTETPTYPLLTVNAFIEHAREAKEIGSQRFGIVTSGRALDSDSVKRIAEAAAVIQQEIGIEVCASLGCLEYEDLVVLKEAGLSRYHHNIETSRRYFPSITTTHTFDDRIRTIEYAKRAGISVCSGCIIGMGENREDRAEIALTLRELEVDSVPVNVLMPILGTPLQDVVPMNVPEALKTIAVFRLVIPDKIIRLTAGRESILKDFQGMAFMAGANGMMTGGYLTKAGRSAEEDQKLVRDILEAWSI